MIPPPSCASLVSARIHSLAPDPGHLTPFGRGSLASLRRGVGKPPGGVPEIWQFTSDLNADESGEWGARRELAIHVALSQWAQHQQSQSAPMHVPTRSFGRALRLLAEHQSPGAPQDAPAYRRMMALSSSRTFAGITTHARGLIAQLRAEGIGFDYASWADDLYWLQVPGRMSDVQRRWGRDFFRTPSTAPAPAPDSSTDNPINPPKDN